MRVIDAIMLLLNGVLTEEELAELPPAARRRFADTLKFWAGVAERPDAPKAGVS